MIAGDIVQTISVIIPAHNAASTIVDTIGSVIRATARHQLEIIVVDDCSVDDTAVILRDYSRKITAPHQLKVIKTFNNRGAGAARNKGFKRATGEYVMFFDADDLLDVGALDKLVDVAVLSKAEMVTCRYRYVVDRAAIAEATMLPEDVKIWRAALSACANGALDPVRHPAIVRMTNYPWNKLIRTDFARSIGLRYSEIPVNNDIAAHWALYTHARTVALCDLDLISHFVIRGNEQVTNVFDARRMAMFTAITEAEEHVVRSSTTIIAFYYHLMQFKLSIIKWAFRRMPTALRRDYLEQVRRSYGVFTYDDYLFMAARAPASANEMYALKYHPEKVLS